MVAEGWDDEALLAALRQALRARQAVPAEFVEAGQNAFAWHNIDAELAQLTYDSTCDPELAPSVRTEAASIRALTFTSAHLIVPTQTATIKVQSRTGPETAVSADEIGCFMIRPIPSLPFRLHCRTGIGIDVLTGWITL